MVATEQQTTQDSDALSRSRRRLLHVCETAGAFIEYWGFKSIHGRVWTLLALSKKPISQVEVARILSVSRALVSQAMAELVSYGLVRPTGDHRNAPYEAVMDIWPVISDVLRSREWMLIERSRVALEALLEEAEIAETFAEETFYDIGRIRLLLSLTVTAQNFLKLVMNLRVPRAVDFLGKGLRTVSNVVRSLRDMD